MDREWAAAFARAAAELSAPSPNLFPEYADDPIGFVRDVGLKVRVRGEAQPLRLWHRQVEVLEDLVRTRRVTCRSGQKTGKSFLAVVAGLSWVLTRPMGSVIIVASVGSQIENNLWPQFTNVYRASGGDARFKPEHPLALQPSTGLRFDEVRRIVGVTARDAEALQGYSGADLLIIVDEASGVRDELYESLLGNTMGGAAMLAIGNPNKTAGWFYRSHTSNADTWCTHHIDSRTTPNYTGEGEPIPGLATPEIVALIAAEYGEDSEQYAIRVAGEFPSQASDAVIGLGQVRDAHRRHREGQPLPGPLTVGVDVARFGADDSAIQPVRGHWAYPQTTIHGAATQQLTQTVLDAIERARVHPGELATVLVDSAGGWGAGVADALGARNDVRVVEVNAGTRSEALDATGQPKFSKTRDELWWGIRDWLNAGGALPPDVRLEEELLAPTYTHDAAGRIKVQSKDDIKKNLGRSPDRADALALAVYDHTQARVEYHRPQTPLVNRRMKAPRLKRGRNTF